jgi:hypothetical protein
MLVAIVLMALFPARRLPPLSPCRRVRGPARPCRASFHIRLRVARTLDFVFTALPPLGPGVRQGRLGGRLSEPCRRLAGTVILFSVDGGELVHAVLTYRGITSHHRLSRFVQGDASRTTRANIRCATTCGRSPRCRSERPARPTVRRHRSGRIESDHPLVLDLMGNTGNGRSNDLMFLIFCRCPAWCFLGQRLGNVGNRGAASGGRIPFGFVVGLGRCPCCPLVAHPGNLRGNMKIACFTMP